MGGVALPPEGKRRVKEGVSLVIERKGMNRDRREAVRFRVETEGKEKGRVSLEGSRGGKRMLPQD